jgi:aminoglycoside phosphotransferase (APT) family kinase protein
MGQFVSEGEVPFGPGDVLVERCLGAAITSVRELPAPRSPNTSYAVRRLMVELSDSRTLDVFLKDFDVSRHNRDVALAHGLRERYVYEKVLAASGLGTPGLYGVVWEGPGGNHWLLLEFFEGQKLRKTDEDRLAAAEWLGRLHANVAGREAGLALAEGPLLKYNDAYFRETAERALEMVGSRFGWLARRLEAVVAGYEATVEEICSAEPTLVHGSYRRQNILVDSCSPPTRICPVDWEWSAIGPPMLDLAFITDGCDRPTVERLCEAYVAQTADLRHAVTGTDEMPKELERLRLHKTLRSLAHSAEWAYPADTVARIVAKAEAIRRALD